MKATIVYEGLHGDQEIKVNDHHLQLGGANGDGYCYSHNGFDCVYNLSDEERKALQHPVNTFQPEFD